MAKTHMNGVDIASYQAALDCGKIDADFVIIKATQGTTYVNPEFGRHYAQAAAAGKLIGAYHYASGTDAEKEADRFLQIIGHRIGDCILCLDWEHNRGGGENYVYGTAAEVGWCKRFADRIHDKTGVWPIMYMSASVTRRRDWSQVAEHCGLWMAQYADYSLTGYQAEPWTDGKTCGAWGRNILIHQYTPSGSISGYRCTKQHCLDLDISYISRDQWTAYAKGSAKGQKEDLFPDKTDKDLAVEILFDIYGSGAVRREKLGSRYSRAQDMVEFYMDSAGDMLQAIMAYRDKHGTVPEKGKT